jgi:hypothetical protein
MKKVSRSFLIVTLIVMTGFFISLVGTIPQAQAKVSGKEIKIGFACGVTGS